MNINLTAPINPLGYGVAGLNILKSLVNSGHSVAYFPIGTPQPSAEDLEVIQKCIDLQQRFDSRAPSIKLWHQHDLAQHVGHGIKVGFPIFELDTFTETELHHLGAMDRIFVCSKWAKGIVEENLEAYSPDKSYFNEIDVRVVPLGVDRDIFYDLPAETTGRTVFLNIGKWEIRKGHDVLCKAFNDAFEPADNVELWMMNHNPFLSEHALDEWTKMYKGSKLGNKVQILSRVERHEDVADIMRKADCGVFPSRGEGWNLEALEMMSCGKQVIATDYSAHTEFCNEENCKLIPVSDKTEAYDGIWFKGQGMWADIGNSETDCLIEHMRTVHKQNKEGKDIINRAGIQTAARYSWKNTADSIIRHVT